MDALLTDLLDVLRRTGLDAVLILAGAAGLGGLGYAVVHRSLRALMGDLEWAAPLRGALLRRTRAPLRILAPVLCVYLALPTVRASLPGVARTVLGNALQALVVVGGAWMLVAVLYAVEEAVSVRYETDTPDNLQGRKIVTQTRILRRIAATVITIVAAGLVLMQYEPFRELGTGILASAGIAGIVVGVAAQRTLGDLIAGIQIALTQPIRVDDAVIVEGEFGWVEEITLTYVVVQVWDRRRIVLPITHFLEQPFQNWTRTSTDLIGTVFLYLDYTVPIDDLRAELRRIVEASEHWDHDVVGLQMTDASERTVTLRATASAKDAPTLWTLRCEIREKLVAYIREHYPDALPTLRTRLETSEDGERLDNDGDAQGPM
ncbi:mechanosensitive ion channel family protein [Salinibacter altiplanensis]|uniref:mechanosensitive ion channel family protein n=1 Tax=Salinibacter altiplanensis TaxID=1803181 RepID=UPI000C9EEBEC|nr:mechanosensitive ion channel domain-containing protein [Salinibacter altiplanensis]